MSRKSGATRIVSTKAKCRHGERRLSWNSSGPAGPSGLPGAAGTPGAAGKAGADGVGVDYGSSKGSSEPVHLAAGAETVVLSKTLPAGSYFVSAQSTVAVGEAKSIALVALVCGIADSAGTPAIVESSPPLDESVWLQELVETSAGKWGGETDMALEAQLTTTVPTTLALICAPIEGTTGATVEAFDPQLSALQTTANA